MRIAKWLECAFVLHVTYQIAEAVIAESDIRELL